jgi:hypothetical protein
MVSCVALTSLCPRPASAAPPLTASPPLTAATYDYSQRIDVNRLSMVVTNFGSFALDWNTFGAGLEFPRGTGRTAVFASGLWVGAKVDDSVRVAVAEYSTEYGPGAMLPGGLPDDPSKPEYKVYKLSRQYPTAGERDAALADYSAGAVPHGAPPVAVRADGTLDITGDQMTWAVFNDAEALSHTNTAGSTAPLGVEVQQTVFAFNRPGALGNTVFVKFSIVNKGSAVLGDFCAALWCDPDLGNPFDDLVGFDPARRLGYCYNGDNPDSIYGAAPPAVGYDLLRATRLSGGPPLDSTAFIMYINGTDPHDASETYNFMRGRAADGNFIIDPTTGQPTYVMFPGDPVTGTGWRDSIPADRRFLLSSGRCQLSPGDTIELVGAIVVGDGSDRLASITRLLSLDDDAQQAFDDGFPAAPGCPITMGFDLTPNTLNLHSMGRWVTAHLEPPAPFVPGDIDVGSILLNGTLPVDPAAPLSIGDYDGNGAPDLTVKFDRTALRQILPPGPAVPVTVTGQVGGQCFTGIDVVRVIHTNVTAPAEWSVLAPQTTTTVRWQTPYGVDVQWVAVLSSLDDGATWTLEADHLPNTGSYVWQTPNAQSSQCRVAVVLVETVYPTDDLVEGVLGIGSTFTINSTTGVGGDRRVAFSLQGIAPNPGRGPLNVNFSLADLGPAVVALYDVAGRQVWVRELHGLGRGAHTLTLPGTEALPGGTYLVRLTQGGRSLVTRAVVMP